MHDGLGVEKAAGGHSWEGPVHEALVVGLGGSCAQGLGSGGSSSWPLSCEGVHQHAPSIPALKGKQGFKDSSSVATCWRLLCNTDAWAYHRWA